eukprot:COSAG06_NODE_35059_length_472_cov_0.833333_2_plen_23_part_01
MEEETARVLGLALGAGLRECFRG